MLAPPLARPALPRLPDGSLPQATDFQNLGNSLGTGPITIASLCHVYSTMVLHIYSPLTVLGGGFHHAPLTEDTEPLGRQAKSSGKCAQAHRGEAWAPNQESLTIRGHGFPHCAGWLLSGCARREEMSGMIGG